MHSPPSDDICISNKFSININNNKTISHSPVRLGLLPLPPVAFPTTLLRPPIPLAPTSPLLPIPLNTLPLPTPTPSPRPPLLLPSLLWATLALCALWLFGSAPWVFEIVERWQLGGSDGLRGRGGEGVGVCKWGRGMWGA